MSVERRYACARHMSVTVSTSANFLMVGSSIESPATATLSLTVAPGSTFPATNSATLVQISSGSPYLASRTSRYREASESASYSHARAGGASSAGARAAARGPSAVRARGEASSSLARSGSSQRRRRTQPLTPAPQSRRRRRAVPVTSSRPPASASCAGGGGGGGGGGSGSPLQPRCAAATAACSASFARRPSGRVTDGAKARPARTAARLWPRGVTSSSRPSEPCARSDVSFAARSRPTTSQRRQLPSEATSSPKVVARKEPLSSTSRVPSLSTADRTRTSTSYSCAAARPKRTAAPRRSCSEPLRPPPLPLPPRPTRWWRRWPSAESGLSTSKSKRESSPRTWSPSRRTEIRPSNSSVRRTSSSRAIRSSPDGRTRRTNRSTPAAPYASTVARARAKGAAGPLVLRKSTIEGRDGTRGGQLGAQRRRSVPAISALSSATSLSAKAPPREARRGVDQPAGLPRCPGADTSSESSVSAAPSEVREAYSSCCARQLLPRPDSACDSCTRERPVPFASSRAAPSAVRL
mmetsp:Transcript_27230/g.79719  ORF Transcript_27230/g.79719 Transcript_27230/m.79719 type:complete len:526 (+) Transcript_27230:214-1791(+)